MTDRPFVNLHTHSWYSMLEASMSVEKIVDRALELECGAVALTDTGTGYGLVDFFSTAQRAKIKPILGAEVFVSQDSRFEKRAGIDGREGNLVLLVRNAEGWQNLLMLLSQASLEGMYYRPRVDWELLEKYSAGITVLTGGTGGMLGRAFRNLGEERAENLLKKIQSVFGEKYTYLELVAREYEEQKKLNNFVVQLSQKTNVPVVATSDARYALAEDEEATDTLVCIGKNQQVSDPNRFKFAERNWFKSWEEMCVDFENVPEKLLEQARKNTLAVAETIDFEVKFGQSLLPNFEVGEGETEKSQLRKNCESAVPILFPEAGTELQKKIRERLDYELEVIGNMGFEAYFLIVQDFIQFAKKNGIAVGPGRGSAAGSVVAYLLGITAIDPLEYDLLFERFLNPERISMPDIDIDFSDERRDEVLQYVVEKYGDEKVSKVCTFGTLSAKAALKDVGRVRGVPFGEMNSWTKLLPTRPGLTLTNALEVPDFRTKLEANPALKKVFSVAQKLEGCVRHVGVHACAVIIGKYDLRQTSPLQWAPGADKVKITQFSYQQLEEIGLLKMDFLGLRNLSILERAIDHIRLVTGEELDLKTIPIDDKKTFEMFSRGETTGVFQFESAGMRRYLRELKPTEFEDLVAMNALYRPGPMEYIPTYIAGKNGKQEVKYLHPVLESILKKTYGIAVYQEQIMRIAQDFAGFTLGAADILRKAIGKKKMKLLNEQRKKFIEGAVAENRDEKIAVKMFDDIIVPFAGYGFNRSHAVCYARIAYETAYLRANFPVEFMAAMMTTDRNNTDRIVLEMNECQVMKIEVLPPSVNDSGANFTVITEKIDPAQKMIDEKVPDKKIRFGLTAIKGLGEETVDQIIFERKNGGVFASLQDFAERLPVKILNKKTLEALAFSGAFDEFGDRRAVVDSLDDLAQFAREHQQKKESGQLGLFGGVDTTAIEFLLRDSVATKDDILHWERESLGLYVSDHPLRGLGKYFEKFGQLIGKITEEQVGKKIVLHGLVVDVRRILTRRGKNMAILTVEDTSGKIEVAIFPQTYDSAPVFGVDAFLRIRGKVEERDGNFTVIADELKVGNLGQVQRTHAFSEQRGEAVPIEILIPAGVTKKQVAELKLALRSLESSRTEAVPVRITIDKKKMMLPFKILPSEDFEQQLKKILC